MIINPLNQVGIPASIATNLYNYAAAVGSFQAHLDALSALSNSHNVAPREVGSSIQNLKVIKDKLSATENIAAAILNGDHTQSSIIGLNTKLIEAKYWLEFLTESRNKVTDAVNHLLNLSI